MEYLYFGECVYWSRTLILVPGEPPEKVLSLNEPAQHICVNIFSPRAGPAHLRRYLIYKKFLSSVPRRGR